MKCVKEKALNFMLFDCILLFIISTVFFIKKKEQTRNQEEDTKQLSILAHSNMRAETDNKEKALSLTQDGNKSETIQQNDLPRQTINIEGLSQINDDVLGWITIEGTDVDYPVMKTSDNYYLTHDFYKEESRYGVPFIDKNCDLSNGCDNIIVYGHNMKDGSMFAPLLKYKEETYCKEHPIICFETNDGMKEYEIFAVYQVKLKDADESTFLYYKYTKEDGSQTYLDYMNQIEKEALYDTGRQPKDKRQLITLSTCDRSLEDGRFVVTAYER